MTTALRRVLSATAVLSIGTLSALPFYRAADPTTATDQPHPTPSPTRPWPEEPSPQRSIREPADAPVPATVDQSSPVRTQPVLDAVAFPSSPPVTGSRQPLPKNLPNAQEQVPPTAAISTDRPTESPVAPAQADSATYSWRTHRILDGDTLEGLAERFLGNPARWPEIRTANRELLVAEDVLPIGKTLRIPPRDLPAVSSDNQLVPIPWPK